jgi:RNA polymerase sigma-70 factor (ECF subfamily)
MNELFQRIENEIPRLRRYARALTRDASAADDLVQDCLTRALDKAHLWREGTDLRAWLFTILHNQHVNRVRRTIREGISVNAEDVEWALVAASSQFARVELRELGAALDRLPEEQRQVVLLVGLEGLRYEAVAEIMGVPVGTIRSRLSRGRDALRQMMGGESTGTFRKRHAEETGRPSRHAATAEAAQRALA